MTSEARRFRDSPWVRRLPLLIVAAVGIFFFLPHGGHLPHDVKVEYELGSAASGLQSVDIEIFDSRGQQVHRTYIRGASAQHPTQKLRLPDGDYRVVLELEYASRVDHRASSLHVEGEGPVELDVSQR